jgi:xanthine dehydrogenase accessory factor
MAHDFFHPLHQALQTEPVVVAIVTKTQGSVPREAGALMGITSDRTWGTIGGGAGEHKVIQAARQVLQDGRSQRITIDLSGVTTRPTQGVCGGWMTVMLHRWQGTEAIALTDSILHSLSAGQSVTLALPCDRATLPQLTSATSTSDAIVYQTLHPNPTLLIVGAGHVGMALAQVAHFVGFQIWIQDDRPDIDRHVLPPDTILHHEPIPSWLSALPEQCYVALVTRGYPHDLAALRSLLTYPTPPRYLGMIGSQKRVRLVLNELEPDERDRLQPIYAPIGLDIGAETPEEIAVSICAELIQVRRGGSGRSLSGRSVVALGTP